MHLRARVREKIHFLCLLLCLHGFTLLSILFPLPQVLVHHCFVTWRELDTYFALHWPLDVEWHQIVEVQPRTTTWNSQWTQLLYPRRLSLHWWAYLWVSIVCARYLFHGTRKSMFPIFLMRENRLPSIKESQSLLKHNNKATNNTKYSGRKQIWNQNVRPHCNWRFDAFPGSKSWSKRWQFINVCEGSWQWAKSISAQW